MKHPLILFGLKNCGKSYWGKKCAAVSGLPFIDTDSLIEARYGYISGDSLSCRSIYRLLGEEGFRALEQSVVFSLEAYPPSIVALGGGTVIDPSNLTYLQEIGKLIYLKADQETLKQRTLAQELPAFIDPENPITSFETLYCERIAHYEAIAAVTIDLSLNEEDIIKQMKGYIYGK